MSMRNLIFTAALVSLPITISPAFTQEQMRTWELETGIDYYVGKYGLSSDTTVFAVPFSAKLFVDQLRLEFGFSYLNLEGPGAFAVGPGTPIIVEQSGEQIEQITSRSGFGDTTIGGAVSVFRTENSASGVEVSGTAKLPTAESGLGTGSSDFTAQLNLYHSLTPTLIVSSSLGYQWLGDYGDFELKHGLIGTVGLNYQANQTTAIGGSLNYRQEPWDGIGERVSLTPYVLWRFIGNWGIMAYGTVGLTEASPRLGTGLRLTTYR